MKKSNILFPVFIAILLLAISHVENVHAKRQWRHEGLLIDYRDITFINEHIDEEPWLSALKNLQERCLSNTDDMPDEPEALADMLLSQSTLYALTKDKASLEHSKTALKSLLKIEEIHDEKRVFVLLNTSMAFELIRQAKAVPGELKTNTLQWLKMELENITSEKTFFVHPTRMAYAVSLEDEELYKRCEKAFLQALKDKFNDDGSLKESLPIKAHVELVSAMTVMAQIANHHGDLFWGNDLYHHAYGPKNFHAVCQTLFNRIIDENTQDSVQHWGWLEPATKTYGEPAWLSFLGEIRPVYDTWLGGPVTLTHARWLKSGLPDFGKAPDGFYWLYNKKDLSGWQYSSRWYDIDENDFYVEDGIVKTRGASDHWLMTDRMYDRFILRLEYKIGKGSNSGLFIWAPIPGRPSKTGFEVQLLDDVGQPPKKNGSGSLYNVVAPKVNAQKPAGEWNEIEFICNDPYLKVTLNEQVIQDINLDQYPETQGRRRRGYIGLQDHSHRVQFRNMRIKPLEAKKN